MIWNMQTYEREKNCLWRNKEINLRGKGSEWKNAYLSKRVWKVKAKLSIIWVWVSPHREVANSLFLKLYFFEVDWQSTGKALSFAESVFLNNQSRMSIAANCCCCLLLKILMNYISQCRDIRANFSLRLWSSFCKMIGKRTIINTTNTSFFFRLAVLLLGMPYRLFKHLNQVFRDLKSSEVWGTTKKPPLKISTHFCHSPKSSIHCLAQQKSFSSDSVNHSKTRGQLSGNF